MLTNEQRAHDIAVAMLPTIYSIEANNAILLKQSTDINIYAKYIEIYELTLNAINRDFPTQQ